jgi:hypothetical protein
VPALVTQAAESVDISIDTPMSPPVWALLLSMGLVPVEG